MCGIWVYLGYCPKSVVQECTKCISARGPEQLQTFSVDKKVHFGFTRLAINDLTTSGMQPMQHKNLTWICNGEIYNWRELKERHSLSTTSDSDCSILGPLWEKFGSDPMTFFQLLDGVFAMAIYDSSTNVLTVARDPYGVRPLFYSDSPRAFCSEMKGLLSINPHNVMPFLPGTYAQYSLQTHDIRTEQYHIVPTLKNPLFSPPNPVQYAYTALYDALRQAVKKRVVNSERPIAALLSGGIDSSLIASLVQNELKALGRPSLETYSIGFEGSTDLYYARKVADHIGSNHTEIIVTPDDFFNAIPEVIEAIESYDITSVRASVGNWMVCREIAKRSKAKVIFNGDGSDEVFGSYLYFFRAPDDDSFEMESARLLKDIHLYDVLRSDRSISSHGLEPRTPFLDRQFVAVARSIGTVWRRPVKDRSDELYMERSNPPEVEPRPEKWILRKAFEPYNLLPSEVLWRQKEAFSDGVSGTSKAWYQEIQERIASGRVSLSRKKFTHLSPPTDEAQYYRELFDAKYGASCERVFSYFWMPKWSGETTDPSARTLSLYK